MRKYEDWIQWQKAVIKEEYCQGVDERTTGAEPGRRAAADRDGVFEQG